MKIIRIFPTKTNMTPIDENVRIGKYPSLFYDEADEIHISVAFTWDIPFAESLYEQWKYVAQTKIGGPALNDIPGEFIPGMYLKKGVTITSRGCHNKCWFCSVWKKNPVVKELEINPGHIIQDDNLLGCSEQHIHYVFDMLRRQKESIEFNGGIEAKLLKPWHVKLLSSIKIKQLFCAYDTPDDLEPLIYAGKLLTSSGITLQNRKARCYVLIGFPKDTICEAEKRIKQTIDAGFFPFAMLWKDDKGSVRYGWKQFQRQWSNPTIIASNVNEYLEE